MGGNRIQGNIPPSLGNSIQLGVLNLSFNDMVGEIPKEFGKMARMQTLVLNNNRLSGVVPQDLGSLGELSYLDLSINKLNGTIPFSLGDCSKLHFLNLSNNGFTGEIPVQLGRLVQLSDLDLSHNSLIKEIPSGLSSLRSLETLNLSHNKLSGNIPNSFDTMNALWKIDLSYNHLRGPLPKSKGFMNLTIEALQGNGDLCGNVTGLKQCTSSESHTPNRKQKLALVISLPLLGALLLGALMGIFTFYSCRSKSQRVKTLPSTQLVKGHNFFSVSTFNGRETYEEILAHTEQSILHRNGRMWKCLQSEVVIRALTRIRHRNIVKLLGYCSHSQNSFLVYEYHEGGSLANILSNKNAQNLDWMKRVNIIKGVAYALSYMHHDCSPPIIHRDISSKNILLDSDYEACVSDFGTSKILNPNSSNWSNVAGTLGYLAPVLEIIKGEHPGDTITSLASSPTEMVKFTDMVDHRLLVLLPEIKEVLTSILILAIICVNSNPEIRPTMNEVSQTIACIIHDIRKGDAVV
ncbi:hypothetical protein L1987_54897 [Smallanthus sonchifolius]|uniref:Uncharacterized protein n=1 Tax=Smallanthus sonchifolius TaxID=185202 RepID=A0ACB9E929_9ASTR|nr:hypothetical protein L1987_54897 [Smallanthus sonchifolius]